VTIRLLKHALELLVRLIEEFEQKHYAIAASSPHSRLLHLMEARSLGCVDLVDVLGSLDVAEAIVEGRSPYVITTGDRA
jgi:HTH-type transcriptional regulator / antitoxin HigA